VLFSVCVSFTLFTFLPPFLFFLACPCFLFHVGSSIAAFVDSFMLLDAATIDE